MQWYFNDQEIEANDKYMITFDGTYATLFIASCTMEDMGEFKCKFENSAGTDETTGKVTVKPVSTTSIQLLSIITRPSVISIFEIRKVYTSFMQNRK